MLAVTTSSVISSTWVFALEAADTVTRMPLPHLPGLFAVMTTELMAAAAALASSGATRIT